MARTSTTVAIEGHTYEITKVGALEGRQLTVLFSRLLSKLLPFIAGEKLDAEAIGAIGEVMQSIEPDELEPLWNAYSANTMVLGYKGANTRARLSEVFDDWFADDLYAMMLFFVEASKHNFGDFLSRALATASTSGKQAAASQSKSPSTSTGSSGA